MWDSFEQAGRDYGSEQVGQSLRAGGFPTSCAWGQATANLLGDFFLYDQGNSMDLLLILIVLLLLFGGGGGLYWGLGAGWGIGPIGLIVLVLVVAFLLNGRRGRRL